MDRTKYFTAIVAFNRPSHIKKCINAIKVAKEKFKGELIFTVIIDRDNTESPKWKKTIKVCKESGFTFQINKKNKGLRNNILGIIKKFQESNYDRLIIIEDDIIVKKDFFNLFQKMFDDYENDNKVFQISGFSPLDYNTNDTVFYPRLSTWGWGTWKKKLPVQKDILIDWEKFKLTKEQKIYYKLYYPDVLRLHKLQSKKKIHAWSLDYLHYMCENKLVTAYPSKSYIKNIGFDGTGTNSRNSNPLIKPIKNFFFKKNKISNHRNKTAQNLFLDYYSNTVMSKVKKKLGFN